MTDSPFVPFIAPQVPQVTGVPALLDQVIATALPVLATADAVGAFASGGQQWGIFPNGGGSAILPADSVGSVEYAQDFRISDYPQEQGAFQSYNKVQVPFQAKVQFLLNQDREPFLQGIGQQLSSLDLVTVVTPEIAYPNANLIHFGYRRTARGGVTLIVADVWCEEIRITATTQLSDTQSQNGQVAQQDGTVQPASTTVAPTDPNTGQLSPGASPSTYATDPSLTGLVTPNIGPAFYTANNLPSVPNDASALSSAQLDNTLSFGQSNGATGAQVSPPDASGNAIVTYQGPF